MDDVSYSTNYADSPAGSAEKTEAGIKTAPASCCDEVLRDEIGRNVMTWISAGRPQDHQTEPGSDRKSRF